MSQPKEPALFKFQELWDQFELGRKKDPKILANEFDTIKILQPNIISEMMVVML